MQAGEEAYGGQGVDAPAQVPGAGAKLFPEIRRMRGGCDAREATLRSEFLIIHVAEGADAAAEDDAAGARQALDHEGIEPHAGRQARQIRDEGGHGVKRPGDDERRRTLGAGDGNCSLSSGRSSSTHRPRARAASFTSANVPSPLFGSS